MNTSTWARWLIHAILMLITAVLGLTSACGDLLDDVAQDATTTDDDNDPCIAYDAETCQAHSECFAWWGDLQDTDRGCRTAAFIGCEALDPTRGCNQGTPVAVGPDGSCWEFVNGCLPQGYNEVQPDNQECSETVFAQLQACPQN